MAVIPWEIPKVCKVGQWTVSTPHNKKIAHCILFNHVPARKKGFLLTLLFPVHVYENTWQVSILRSDKAAVTGRGHGQYKAKTGDRLIIEIFQVSCQLQGQTRLPIHFFSVSCCPFNLADFCDSMEICTWAYIFSLDWNQWGGCFLFRSFLSGNGWISCLRNNQEDGRNQAYFPWCIFLSVNKKTNDFIKEFAYVCWFIFDPYVQSLKNAKALSYFPTLDLVGQIDTTYTYTH